MAFSLLVIILGMSCQCLAARRITRSTTLLTSGAEPKQSLRLIFCFATICLVISVAAMTPAVFGLFFIFPVRPDYWLSPLREFVQSNFGDKYLPATVAVACVAIFATFIIEGLWMRLYSAIEKR
jgi:hypothetical protein